MENGEKISKKLRKKPLAVKKFSAVDCKCRMNCRKIFNEEDQQFVFEKFHALSNWTLQTAFILNLIQETKYNTRRLRKYRKRIESKRNFSRNFCLITREEKRISVCRIFFLKVLQLNRNKIQYCMEKKRKVGPVLCISDDRGKQPCKNKVSNEAVKNVIRFISTFPRHESHYARERISSKYLPSFLNISKMYELYNKDCLETTFNPVSKYMFRDIFKRRLNLKFKPPQIDTCSRCDSMNNAIRNTTTSIQKKNTLIAQKNIHLDTVDHVKKEYYKNVSESKESDGKIVVLVFDLQKVLETPMLRTNNYYYKSKLSTYNFCIHNATTNQSYMYVWHEAIASRGAQEIGSCILHYFKNYLSTSCKKVKMYSDACCGQNKNIKLFSMLNQFVLNSEQIDEIQQFFYVSGHSFNACDRRFSIIERARKKISCIYDLNQWINLIKDSKKKHPRFEVIKMQRNDFVSSSNLEKFLQNRKLTTDGEKVNWFKIHVILYLKQNELELVYKNYGSNCDETLIPKVIKMNKRGCNIDQFKSAKLDMLYCNRELPEEKKKDLSFLLKFIPEEHHSFYINTLGVVPSYDLMEDEMDKEDCINLCLDS